MSSNTRKSVLIASLVVVALGMVVSVLILSNVRHSKKWTSRPPESSPNNRQFISTTNNSSPGLATSQSPTTHPSQTNATAPTRENTPTFESIKRMLDISMQRVGASYVGHQNIVRYSDKSERISFIYKKGQIPTGQTLQDLAQTAERGLRNKTVADTKMAQARASNNTNMIKEAARLQVQANRDIYQTEQCLTVEISPSMNAPPVTKFQEGIPEWLAYRQTAFDLANNILTSPPQLVEVAAIATFSESVFTFTDAGGARIYVKPRSGQVFTSVRIEEEPPKPAQLPPQEQADRQQRISQQWAEFMQTGINMDQFNLSGLNDLSKQK